MGFAIQFVLGVILANYFRAKIVILLVCLGLCTVSLLILHFRVANLNSMSSTSGSVDEDITTNGDYKPIVDDKEEGKDEDVTSF